MARDAVLLRYNILALTQGHPGFSLAKQVLLHMSNAPLTISPEYWQDFTVTPSDIEFIQNHLFETETPLTAK